MKKPVPAFTFLQPRILLTVVALASFLFSLEAGVVGSAGNREEASAIYVANGSSRDLALTNSQSTRTDRNLSKPKPENRNAQPGGLPVKFVAPHQVIQRLLFAGDGSLVCASAYSSQPRGRAPPDIS